MSELEKVREEWGMEGLSVSEIEENLRTLSEVYIGQNIRSEGILKSHFKNQIQISNLIKKGLIKENKWYRHDLYLTTERGSKIAQEFIEKELKMKEEQLLHIGDDIPPNLLRFLLFDYFAESLSFPCDNEYFFDWRGPLFKDSRIIASRDKILNRLEKLGLCVKTYYYVSTRGGELRDMHFVISPEIQKKLLTLRPAWSGGLENPFRKKCIIFHFLTERVVSLVKPLELTPDTPGYQEELNFRRQGYWNALENLNLTEEDIKPVIHELAKDKITSEYRGLFYKGLPFKINDEIRYSIVLKKMLIDPVLSYLFEEEGIIGKIEPKEAEREIPPGLVSKEEKLNFFDELGNFETKLRDFIASKLGKELQRCKDKDLVEKLKRRREEEHNFGLKVEDLINYATFDEYATIILSHWETFKKYFGEEDFVGFSLRFINVMARRPLAHFRNLTRTKMDEARDKMRKILQKIGET